MDGDIFFQICRFYPPGMRAPTPCLRASYALRTPWITPILVHMENFPTPKQSAVPRIANALTIAFLAGTTWWSSAQRPVLAEPPIALNTRQASLPAAARHTVAPAGAQAQVLRAPLSGNVAGDAIVSVGFTGASLR